MRLAFLSLFALSAVVLAQSSALPKPAVVEGKVVGSVAGEPLRKVELTLTTSLESDSADAMMAMFGGDDASEPAQPKPPKKSFSATTDAAGKFRFEVEAGDYYLMAKHAGSVDTTYKPEGKYDASGKVHLTAGDELTQVVIKMVPQGAVSGRVVDEDGDPVANAMVSAQSYTYSSDGHRHLSPADAAQANDRGEFRLGKLRPGHYYLSASIMNISAMMETQPAPKDGSPETAYVTTYYPKTVDVTQASAIDVAAGADLPGLVIQMQKSKVVRIKGKLLNSDGTPLKNGQVMLMSAGNMSSMQMKMVNDPQGRFEIANVQPGSYNLMTVQLGGSTPSIHMQPLIVPTEGVDNVQIGGQAEGTVDGRITVAGDGKVELKGLMVMLGGEESMTMPVISRTSDAGAFTLKKVSPTPYQVSVSGVPAGAYVKSVQWGNREKLGQPIDFSAGFAGPLQIVLGTDGGQFDATVSHGDKPAAGATVVLISADPATRFAETTRSEEADSTGHVTFKDLPPGSYLALAWEQVESQAWFDPAFIKSFQNQAVSVTIQAKGHETAKLAVIPAK